MTKNQKALSMYKLGMVAAACALVVQVAYGQSAADALRNIEQTKPAATQPKPAPRKPAVAATTDQGFARLKEIKVNSPLFQADLLTYWASEINQPVSAQKLAEFKAFAWELFQNKGYLAYITTSAQPTPEGSVLTVNVSFPAVGKVSVVTVDGNKGKEFADEVGRRFAEVYKAGVPADVQGFENQLNAIAYDLPVDLEVSLRQVNDKTVDVVINLRPVETKPGSVVGGLVQLNNYGLSQFGREQLLANVRVAGLTPLSELSLTTQQSRGVAYYRADYEAPITGTGVRWKVFASDVHSYSGNVEGGSQEVGFGLTKLLSTSRTTRWYGGVEVAERETWSWLSSVESQDRVDKQLRFKLRSESSKGVVDSYTNEFIFTAGYLALDGNLEDNTKRIAGGYQKLEMNGGLSHALDNSRLYTGSVRWRAQTAANNLDTYNQISLGGVNGIRALTTLDGVGDTGAQLSFDLTHQYTANLYSGVFYDMGVVKPLHTDIPGNGNNDAYMLHGAGVQFGGNVDKVNWALSIAKSFGQTPSSWPATGTHIGDWRGNLAITYGF